MAQNRHLPYGYLIENGKISINYEESEVVIKIYKSYAKGLSYKTIAEQLTYEGIRYMSEKPIWNKNMVARILQNPAYLGNEKYPKIIDDILYQEVQQMMKPYTHTESADIKNLKPLLVCDKCGAKVKRRLKTSGEERWYCVNDANHISIYLKDSILKDSILVIQNHITENPQLTKSHDKTHNNVSLDSIRLQNEIDKLIGRFEIDEKLIKEKIMELASRRYEDCWYDNDKALKYILGQTENELDVSLILKISKEIRITSNGANSMVLKNENTVKRGN